MVFFGGVFKIKLHIAPFSINQSDPITLTCVTNPQPHLMDMEMKFEKNENNKFEPVTINPNTIENTNKNSNWGTP